ncbi:MAG: ATP synthase epsilon chain [Planctomycetes bacterium]|nr:ATP synthase epsilon chain [Planctomycetota bacterium]
MTAAFRCTVVSPERPLFEGGVDKVVAPGARGQIAVLRGHAPLIAKLDPGVIRIHRAADEGGAVERLAVSGGFLQVRRGQLTLLVTDAVKQDDIDRGALERELGETLEALRHPKSDEDFRTLLSKRRSVQAKIEVAGRK